MGKRDKRTLKAGKKMRPKGATRTAAAGIRGKQLKRYKLPAVFKKPPEVVAARRHCGDCTACCTCTTLAVPGCKPLGGVCAHLRSTRKGRKPGCSIYTAKPPHCRDYSCYWRMGVLTGHERPDRLGVIFDSAAPEVKRVIASAGVPVVLARETYTGSGTTTKAKVAILAMTQKFGVIRVGLPGGPIVHAASAELTDKIIEAVRIAHAPPVNVAELEPEPGDP
jgi:hypothetical protein